MDTRKSDKPEYDSKLNYSELVDEIRAAQKQIFEGPEFDQRKEGRDKLVCIAQKILNDNDYCLADEHPLTQTVYGVLAMETGHGGQLIYPADDVSEMNGIVSSYSVDEYELTIEKFQRYERQIRADFYRVEPDDTGDSGNDSPTDEVPLW